MEIYRNSTDAKVTLQAPSTVVPVSGTLDIKAVDNEGKTLHSFTTATAVADGYSVDLPWSLTRQDSNFYVDWKFDYVDSSETFHVNERIEVSVVSPILSLVEVKSISGLTDDNDVADLERRVRFAIQAYTVTTFNKFVGTIPVEGNGDEKLALPLPLLRLDFPSSLFVYSGGWSVGQATYYSGGIKSAPPEYILDQMSASAGPIYAPFNNTKVWFADDVKYNITGLWGYYEVPADVQQAARLLIADYACDESLWRDRYINAIKAGDWRIDFNGAAFSGTGNVIADQILSQYRRTGLVAI